jgi:hypothetical protein
MRRHEQGTKGDVVTAASDSRSIDEQPTQAGTLAIGKPGRSKRFQKPAGCVITTHSPMVLTPYPAKFRRFARFLGVTLLPYLVPTQPQHGGDRSSGLRALSER